MTLPSWYRKIEGRVFNMIGRAKVERLVEGKLQIASMSTGPEEAYRDVERVQNYGFTSLPGPNANGVALFLTGSKELPLLMSVDHPLLRKKIGTWDSAMYTVDPVDKSKISSFVHLKADGTLDISADKELILKTAKAAVDFGTELSITVNKFAVTSGPNELISILSDFLKEFETIASDPVSPGAPATFAALNIKAAALRAKLDSFKG